MRPLLLHASSPSRVPAHRRVLHLDFASVHLPNNMVWFSEAARHLHRGAYTKDQNRTPRRAPSPEHGNPRHQSLDRLLKVGLPANLHPGHL